MIGAVITALIAGVVARILTPGDIFRHMSGPKSCGISLLIGFGGVALGYLIFTVGLGIGDTKVFDFGGIIGAIIILVIVGFVARWSQHKSPPASPTAPTT
ncbi:MAG: GlsB/YeaQ/YmgE family stress response membrane protein [Solirubrobacteraceae bacterium]